MLTKTKVRFHKKQKNFESMQEKPILELDPEGKIKQVRYSYFTLAPHILPFDYMEVWYKSYNKFAHLVRYIE